jgi:hypothetical protein
MCVKAMNALATTMDVTTDTDGGMTAAMTMATITVTASTTTGAMSTAAMAAATRA